MARKKATSNFKAISQKFPSMRLLTFAEKLEIDTNDILDWAIQEKISLYVMARDWHFTYHEKRQRDAGTIPFYNDNLNNELIIHSGLVGVTIEDLSEIADFDTVRSTIFNGPNISTYYDSVKYCVLRIEDPNFIKVSISDLIVKLEEFPEWDLSLLFKPTTNHIQQDLNVAAPLDSAKTQMQNQDIPKSKTPKNASNKNKIDINELLDKPLGKRERETLMKTIGALVLCISKTNRKYIKNNKLNISEISKELDSVVTGIVQDNSDVAFVKENLGKLRGLGLASLNKNCKLGHKALLAVLPKE